MEGLCGNWGADADEVVGGSWVSIYIVCNETEENKLYCHILQLHTTCMGHKAIREPRIMLIYMNKGVKNISFFEKLLIIRHRLANPSFQFVFIYTAYFHYFHVVSSTGF